ncbi:MAG: carboxymuconolactone decarboxylase family protein [Ferrovibrio sp.]|uniref:carboxymuconolactone decarboxylase family protein n=1 Tax=Ferrovibrio sp. TaxID=1917215 RepID=UPI00391D0F49
MVKRTTALPSSLPPAARTFATRHKAVWQAYEALGAAAAESGPLDARMRRLVKLALAVGAQAQGAAKSHARRAKADGVSQADMHHLAALAVTTLGLPAAVRAMAWMDEASAGTGKTAKRKYRKEVSHHAVISL